MGRLKVAMTHRLRRIRTSHGRWSRATVPARYQNVLDYWTNLEFKLGGNVRLFYLPKRLYGGSYTPPPPRYNEYGIRFWTGTDSVSARARMRLPYTYDIQGDQLFLTPPPMFGVSSSLVFKR